MTVSLPLTNLNKTFVTFPYPYMNGKLHLGHAYTLSKAVFYAEFRKLNGDDVLFPFAFHGTGMPIAASAAKLKHEYENDNVDKPQTKILLDMGIKPEDIPKFIDPEYWLEYFPNEAKKDLIKFGFNEKDFDRSFITTSLNPHYDAFIKWQFRKLIKKGYLKLGSRYVIYSIKDGQPCADHDRVGSCEGVESKKYDTFLIEFNNYLFIITGVYNSDNGEIFYDPNNEYQSFEYKGQTFVARKFAVLNLLHQVNSITNVTTFNGEFPSNFIKSTKSINATGFISKNKSADNNDIKRKWIDYYEPETEVVSRSGDVCITALTDQWFINYGDPVVKEKVNEYIKDNFFCPDPTVINQLLASSDWINEWPCSRNYGLGTILPDTNYVIDSLSDSTIYMAYYTIAHIIKKININILSNDDVWDYIFMGTNNDLIQFDNETKQQIKLMREQFQYWYPVTLRVSGKDLVPNHLIMCLYNHLMIWDNFDFCPKSYCVNGYLMLNGKKMSKSEGNFMTLGDAVDLFGSDIVRISLCEKEGTEDGDFRNSIAKAYTNKLNDEKKFIISMIDKIYENKCIGNVINSDVTGLWERTFSDELDFVMVKTYENYMNYKFRSVMYDGFHLMLMNRDKYLNICKKTNNLNFTLMKKFIEYLLLILCPICPNWVNEIWNYAENKIMLSHMWTIYNIPQNYNKHKYYSDVIEITQNMINNITNKSECTVEIIKNYTETENMLINTVVGYFNHIKMNNIEDVRDNWNKYISAQNYDKMNIGKYARFAAYVKTNIDQYGFEWINFIKEDQSEYFIKLLPMLCPKINIKIVVVDSDPKYEFKYGVGRVCLI